MFSTTFLMLCVVLSSASAGGKKPKPKPKPKPANVDALLVNPKFRECATCILFRIPPALKCVSPCLISPGQGSLPCFVCLLQFAPECLLDCGFPLTAARYSHKLTKKDLRAIWRTTRGR